MSFSNFSLDPRIAAGIVELGFVEPTPIQARAVPPALEGRDVLGVAQTGTGKTAAFALPVLQRLTARPRRGVRALVLAPTRELAEQIHVAIAALGRRTGTRSAAVYGGVAFGPQVSALRTSSIVVACPGRLLDHLTQRTADLSGLEVLVLDEADRMLDMGFAPDLKKILRYLPAERQTMLFSATMPDEVRRLCRDLLRDPAVVEVGRPAPAASVSQALYPVDAHLKTALLKQVLAGAGAGSVLVFTRTKHRATRLAKQLAASGHRAASLQGDLSQSQRQRAIAGFRDGSFRVLVATDIAARGIDVARVSHVVNYDMPEGVDAYTHRIGRTGRAERAGEAITFVTREDADDVRILERALGARLERRKVEGFDYGAPPPPATALPRARETRPQPPQPRAGRPPRQQRRG